MNLVKKYILLMLCLIWSCTCISQDLKPIVQDINNEKHFCFTVEQSRFIAKKLEFSIYQDSIIKKLKQKNRTWELLTKKKDTVILSLQGKITNFSKIQDNNQSQIKELNATIVKKDRKIKRGKFIRYVLGSGLLIVSGILIAK